MGIKDLVADLNIGYNNSMIRRNDIRQTNLNQTGVAIISLESGNKKIIPLFSLKPMEEAEKLGADAIVGVRFGSSAVMQGAAEMIAFRTAVKLKK